MQDSGVAHGRAAACKQEVGKVARSIPSTRYLTDPSVILVTVFFGLPEPQHNRKFPAHCSETCVSIGTKVSDPT